MADRNKSEVLYVPRRMFAVFLSPQWVNLSRELSRYMSGKILIEIELLEYTCPFYSWLNSWNLSSAENIRSSRSYLHFKSWFHWIGNGVIISPSTKIFIFGNLIFPILYDGNSQPDVHIIYKRILLNLQGSKEFHPIRSIPPT